MAQKEGDGGPPLPPPSPPPTYPPPPPPPCAPPPPYSLVQSLWPYYIIETCVSVLCTIRYKILFLDHNTITIANFHDISWSKHFMAGCPS